MSHVVSVNFKFDPTTRNLTCETHAVQYTGTHAQYNTLPVTFLVVSQ